MTIRAELPSGAWADLLPPDKLKAKHVRAVTRAISDLKSQRVGALVSDMNEGILAMIIQDWSCVDDDGKILPLPSVDLESLGELRFEDYDVLNNHDITAEVTRRYWQLRTEKVTPDDHANPLSPTAPSDASAPALREETSPPTAITGPSGTTPPSTWPSPTDGDGLPARWTNSPQGFTTT